MIDPTLFELSPNISLFFFFFFQNDYELIDLLNSVWQSLQYSNGGFLSSLKLETRLNVANRIATRSLPSIILVFTE